MGTPSNKPTDVAMGTSSMGGATQVGTSNAVGERVGHFLSTTSNYPHSGPTLSEQPHFPTRSVLSFFTAPSESCPFTTSSFNQPNLSRLVQTLHFFSLKAKARMATIFTATCQLHPQFPVAWPSPGTRSFQKSGVSSDAVTVAQLEYRGRTNPYMIDWCGIQP